MAFVWAFTGDNKLCASRTETKIVGVSSSLAGYPAINIIDGNIESKWCGTNTEDYVVIDTNATSPAIEYLWIKLDYPRLPNTLKIESSDDGIMWSSIENNYDGTVTTTTSSNASLTSRLLPVESVSGFYVGNSISVTSGTLSGKYLITDIGANYIIIDKYPSAFTSGAAVKLIPLTYTLVYLQASERKRFFRITLTGTTTTIMEVCGFSVLYSFNNTHLPLNPYPVVIEKNIGSIQRSFSGHGIGKMSMSPSKKRVSFSLARITEDARHALDDILSYNRIGILMDNCEYIEGLLVGNVSFTRRQSSDSNLITYSTQLVLEEV